MISELIKYITGKLTKDCISLLDKYNKHICLNHTINVAKKATKLGKLLNVNTKKLEIAAYLHDISAIIPREKYVDICIEFDEEVIELEKDLPILLHQKVSKIITEEIFNFKDREIHSTIYYHTALRENL